MLSSQCTSHPTVEDFAWKPLLDSRSPSSGMKIEDPILLGPLKQVILSAEGVYLEEQGTCEVLSLASTQRALSS